VGPAAKTLVDIDEKLLAQAAEFLGTKTKKDTINRALQEYIKAQLRMQHIEWLASGGLPDLADPEVMKQAWR
jgi:Arc/MetJ family transcription regulator